MASDGERGRGHSHPQPATRIMKHNQQQYLASCLRVKNGPTLTGPALTLHGHTLQWSVTDAGWEAQQLLWPERLRAH